MLRWVVFLGGSILMALEIVGSRVLAPEYGSSIFVWGSLISIFLAALSVGYYWGGAIADRSPRLSTLGILIGIPGLLIWSLPFWASTTTQTIAALSLGPRFGPLVASLCLFAVPSIFLGTISPYAVRLEMRSVETAGNTAGRLYALSTIGSIVGTLAASFFLIPSVGVRNLLHGLGLALMILSVAVYGVSRRTPSSNKASDQSAKRSPERLMRGSTGQSARGSARDSASRTARASVREPVSRSTTRSPRQPTIGSKRQPKSEIGTTIAMVIGVALVFGLLTPWGAVTADVIFEKDSLYSRIIVEEIAPYRLMRFDNVYQSAINLDDPDELVFGYTRYLHLIRLFSRDPDRALFVGLGGGSSPRSFHNEMPSLSIDVVELDPDVVAAAKRHFSMFEDDRMVIHTMDGRLYLKNDLEPYDIAILDAFSSDMIPFHLTTREFLQMLSDRLTPDGVVASNIIGALAGPQSRLFRAMVKTYQSVFPQVYVFPVGTPGKLDDDVRNIVLLATKSPERITADELSDRADKLVSSGNTRIDVRQFIRSLVAAEIPTDDVPVLTDDYAPVDSLRHF